MADNQRKLYAGRDTPFLSDGDPLAELARIAGYDTAAAPEPAAGDDAAATDAFDLEAELMRSIGAADEPMESAGNANEADELGAEEIPAFLKARPAHEEDEPEPVSAAAEPEPVAEAPSIDAVSADDRVDAAPLAAAAEEEVAAAGAEERLPEDALAGFEELLAVEMEAAASGQAGQPAVDEPDTSFHLPVVELDEPEDAAAFAVDQNDAPALDAEPEFETEEAQLADDIVRSFDDDPEIPASRPEPVALTDDAGEAFVPLSDAGRAVPATSLTDFAPLDETAEDTVWRDMVRYALPIHGPVHADAAQADAVAAGPAEEPVDAELPQAIVEEPIIDAYAPEPALEEPAFEPVAEEPAIQQEPVVLQDAAEPVAGEAMPETVAAAEPRADDPWDIADEIEAAFADFGVARSAAPAALEPVIEETSEPEMDEPQAVEAIEPETVEPETFEPEYIEPETIEPVAEFAEPETEETAFGEAVFTDDGPAGMADETVEAAEPEPYVAVDPAADDFAFESRDEPEMAAIEADELPDIAFDFDDFEMEMQTAAADETVTETAEAAVPPEPELEREPEAAETQPDEPATAPIAAPIAAAAIPAAVAAASATVVPLHGPRRPAILRYESEPLPIRPAASAPVRPAFEREAPAELAFDIHDVADTSDVIEPVGEIEVPDLPEDEELPRADTSDDFDLSGLEAEFADILARNDTEGRRKADTAEAVPAAAGLAAAPLAAGQPDNTDVARGAQIDFADYDFSQMAQGGRTTAPAAAIDDDVTFEPMERPVAGRSEAASRKRIAPWMIGVAAVAVVAAAGLSAYAFLGGGTAGSDGPRVIAASDEPIKVAPADPGGRSVPNQDQAVYGQVSGAGGAGENVNLISRAEEPVDVVQRTVDPMVLPLEGRATGEATPPAEGGSDVAAAGATNDAGPEGLRGAMTANEPLGVAPRVVQTSVVRADGTLVPAAPAAETIDTAAPSEQSGAEAVAAVDGEEALAASRMIAAAETGTDLADGTGQPLSAQAEGATETAAAPGVPLPQPRPEEQAALAVDPEARLTPEGAGAQDALAAPVRTVRTTTLTPDSQPMPGDRPADQPVNIVGQTPGATAPAADAPTETAAATSGAFANPGGYVVQIASQPSQESAEATYDSLSSRFGSVIGGLPVQIQSAEIPDRGTFYRVRVAGGSREEAVALCERYQAAGGSCFVAR